MIRESIAHPRTALGRSSLQQLIAGVLGERGGEERGRVREEGERGREERGRVREEGEREREERGRVREEGE